MITVSRKAVAWIIAVLLLAAPCPGASAASGGAGARPDGAGSPPPHVTLPRVPDISDAKESLTPAERKVSPALLGLVKPGLMPEGVTREQLAGQLQAGRQLTRGPAWGRPGAMLAYVYITLNTGSSIDDLGEFKAMVTDSAPDCNLAAARVDVDRLTELAALKAVKGIETVTPPECSGSDSVTSEGDSLLSADVTRALGGVDGRGVKIGVISNGVDNRSAAIASGDLPPGVVVLRNAQGGDEGTAMLEVVHDLAPGAQLYFHDCGSNRIQFMAAVDKLVAAGCNIICDDVKWLSEPFFEDGVVARHISALLSSKNIVYCTSAGNLARRHYQGAYYAGENGYHDFSRGREASYKYLYLNMPAGGTAEIWLQWNEPFGRASSDYDLYLYNIRTGAYVQQSVYKQSGAENPYEYIYYRNTGASADFLVCVIPYGSPVAARTLEVVLSPGNGATVYNNNLTAADSILGHAALPGVITCGAVNQATPYTLESFSSQGPVTMLNGSRQKPDICGVDGVSITGAGGFGGAAREFTGTSAAAPHIAAIAALIWQKHPGLTAAQVKARICGNAQDLGAAGYDTQYGYGRANARAAALGSAALAPPSALRKTGSASTSITLGWQPVPYADGYELWRAASSAGAYSRVATTASAAATNGGLVTDKTYYYKVRAFWNAASRSYGAFSAAVAAKPAPAAAVAKAAPVSYNGIKLTWSAVAGVTRYEVYRSTSKSSGYRLVRITTARSYSNTGLTTGRTYYYKVRAYRLVSGKKVYGPYSTVVSAKTGIGAPSTIKAAVAGKSVKLSWGGVPGRTKYEVWRRTSQSGVYTLCKTTASTSFANTGLVKGTTYWYKVRAYRAAGGKKVYGSYSIAVRAKP